MFDLLKTVKGIEGGQNKWERHQVNVLKDTIFLRWNFLHIFCRFNTISIEISAGFCIDIDKPVLNTRELEKPKQF